MLKENTSNADGFFGAYVFAFPTTEASFFIDDLNDIIPALNRGQDRFPHRPHRLYSDQEFQSSASRYFPMASWRTDQLGSQQTAKDKSFKFDIKFPLMI